MCGATLRIAIRDAIWWHALRNEGRGKAGNHALRYAPTTCHPRVKVARTSYSHGPPPRMVTDWMIRGGTPETRLTALVTRQ